MIYAWHALNGTEPDWAAMGAGDLGFAVGLTESAVAVVKLSVDLVCWLVDLVEDPQSTVEATLAKIKALPAYIKGAPAAFKEYIDVIQAIEDPYEQGRSLGKLLGGVLPTGAVAGNVVSKAFSKVGRWVKQVRGSWVGKVNRSAAKLTTNSVKLELQLASDAQMYERGRVIVKNLRSGPRLAQQYGGEASDWVKKTSSSFTKNGKKFETHWYENLSTGHRVETKVKLLNP